MFGTLLESRARRERDRKGAAASVVAHAVVIGLAVAVTAQARETPLDDPPVEQIVYTDNARPETPPPTPRTTVERPPVGPVAPDALRDAPVLTTPVGVPDRIPDIDASAPETDASLFAGGARHPGERSAGPAGPVSVDAPMYDFQVERPVLAKGGCQPRFPDVLRSAGLDGRVLAQFVVDTTGRAVVSSFRPLDSTNDLFTASVQACLPSLRFLPAEAGGRKVPQLVQQPFVFALQR